jgi:hypothetical protein
MDKKLVRRKRETVDYVQVGITRSTCHVCLDLVDAQRIIGDGKMYLRKFCPEHGLSEALAYSDAQWYMETLQSPKPGSYPLETSTARRRGCPYDCGLCPSHQQHSCVLITDITDYCPLNCPVCFVNNKNSYFMSLQEWESVLDNVTRCEGHLDARALSFSGGEPTSHPQMLEMAKMALERKPYVNRLCVNTAGLRIARDEEFVHQLAELGVEIDIQFDGFMPETYVALRGKDLTEIKFRALENLEKYGVGTNVFVTLAKHVNDHELGRIALELLPKKFVRSLVIQPLILLGKGLNTYQIDPMDRMTTPGAIACLEEQTAGVIKKSDFSHVPCSNPNCGAVTYVFVSNEREIVTLPTLFGQERYQKLLRNEFLLRIGQVARTAKDVLGELDPEMQKGMETLFKGTGCCCGPLGKTATGRDRDMKLVSIHSFMDRYTLDVDRLMRCCTVYLFPDKRIVPLCAYNTLYRQNDAKYPLPPTTV